MESVGSEFSGGAPGAAAGPQIVNEDIPCRKCGYNLRALGTDGRCPECGTSIWVSLRGTLLRYSDPVWVETIRKGFARMITGITVVVAAIIGGIFVGMLAAATSNLTLMVLVQLVAVVGWVLYMWGTWLITEPDPSGLGEDEYGTSRKIIRVGVATQAMGQVLEFVDVERMSPGMAMLLQIIGIVIAIIFVVALFAQLQYLQKLALRIPDPALSQRARFLKRAIVTAYAVIIVSMIVAVAFGGGAGSVVFVSIGALAGLSLLIFALMYLRLLSRLKRSFQEQVFIAQATWDAAIAAAAT